MSTEFAVYNAAYGATGILALFLAGHRLRSILRHRGDLLAKTVFVAFLSTAFAFLFATPTWYLAFDDLTGIPNGATLAVYLFIPVTSASFLVLLAAWTKQPRARVIRWLLAYGGVVAVMIVLFFQGQPDDAEHPIDFDAYYATQPVLSAFLLLYYAGFAVAMGGTAWLSHRYSQLAAVDRPWLARGLRWTSTGAALAVGYSALKVIAVIGLLLGAGTQALSTRWAPLSATVGALLMAAGLSMPGWGPTATASLTRVRAYRSLHPLWQLVTEAVPSVVLEPHPTFWWSRLTRSWALRDTTHRLYRRVVEIHDARLALGPWLTAATTGSRAPGSPDEAREGAQNEAVMLRDAVRAKARGVPAGSHWPTPSEHGSAWDDQLGWLLAVADELRRLD